MPFTKKNAAESGKKGGKARAEVAAAEDDLPEGPPMPASSAERRKLLDAAHWWAATHSLRTKPPDELHKMMQEMRRSRDPAFFRQVMMPADKDEPVNTPEASVGNFLERVDKMLDEINATHARDEKVLGLLERWEPRLVAAENRPEEPMELWLELARIFRVPLRPAAGDGPAASLAARPPRSQSPMTGTR